MKDKHIYVIVAAVYLAPHVSPMVGIGMGIYMSVCALYAMWKEA